MALKMRAYRGLWQCNTAQHTRLKDADCVQATTLGEAEQRRMLRTKLIRIRVREFAFRTTMFIHVREDVVLPRLEGRAWVQKGGRICAGLHSRSVALTPLT